MDVDDREGFVAALADAFDLSELGAGSWDVLDQHLRALDLDEPNGLLICWEGWGAFAEADPDSFEMAIEIFQDACIAWQYDKFQAAVLLVGDGPETDLRPLAGEPARSAGQPISAARGSGSAGSGPVIRSAARRPEISTMGTPTPGVVPDPANTMFSPHRFLGRNGPVCRNECAEANGEPSAMP